ncbi:MAG: ABC transporter ATP-binding protein [Bdellovibrionaceae bacterium]|nr:ABC transporter ATP-binding protein [Pseudobdellovibrionaceae bacterium]
MSKLIEFKQVHKSYLTRDQEIPVLSGLDFVLLEGQEVCILGASGSGKSTFLHLAAGLDDPTRGEVFYSGRLWRELSEEERSRIRAYEIGFIFQMHHTIRELKAWENVALPLWLRGDPRAEAKDKVFYWLQKVGLEGRFDHYPSELSGGELQRLCIARALVIQPKILFADEPTGSLDSKRALEIQDLLFQMRSELGMALLVVTHDLTFSSRFSRVLRISDGRWV